MSFLARTNPKITLGAGLAVVSTLIILASCAPLGNPPVATPAVSAQPKVSPDTVTFKNQIQESVTTQRPQWSQAQCETLVNLIVSEMTSKMPGRLSQSDTTNVLKSLPHCLSKFDPSPDEPVQKMTQEYFRWAIADLATRKEMPNEKKVELEQDLRDCFSKAATMLKNDLPSDLGGQIDQSAESNLQYALRTMQDPLSPGLKHSIPKEKLEECLKQFADSWQKEKAMLDRHGGITRFKTAEGGYDQFAKDGIEIAFRVLRQQTEYFGVSFDDPLEKAIEEYNAGKAKEFQLKREQKLRGATDKDSTPLPKS